MGGFEKGKSGNPAGRPRGAKDKVQSTLKEWIASIIDGNRQQFEEDLKKCAPADRLRFLLKLFDFILPKLGAIRTEISIDKLSDEEIDVIVNKLEGRDDEDNSR